MHAAGLELTKLTYTRLEDNLIRHRGDRLTIGATGLPSGRPAYHRGDRLTTGATGLPPGRPAYHRGDRLTIGATGLPPGRPAPGNVNKYCVR